MHSSCIAFLLYCIPPVLHSSCIPLHSSCIAIPPVLYSSCIAFLYCIQQTVDAPKPGRSTDIAKLNKPLGLIRYGWEYAAAGVVAVWATENTRPAIFDAMQRKEAYATMGPHIRVRFFGGYEFDADDVGNPRIATLGYSKGVPMGGNLEAAPKKGKAPTFLIAAMKDPTSGNLDRIQVIKGWVDAQGETKELVYDVAWGDAQRRQPDADGVLPLVGNTVDAATSTWTNSIGDAQLTTAWSDPDFDPAQHALYYARVLEIPTPRWTT